MKTKILINSLILTLAVANGFSQQRKVLIEQFTNSGCPPCAGNTPVVATYVNANLGAVLMLAYHTSFPYFDSMYYENPVQSDARVAFYNIVGVPYSKVDGNYFSGNVVPNINTTIQNRSAIAPRYNISFTSSSLNNSMMSATIQFESIDAGNQAENLVAHIVVAEKNVLKSSYVCCAGANTETEYPWVVRRMLPDQNGVVLINKQFGGTDNLTVNWMADNIKDFSELRIIAFVQNLLTKEIYQAELSEPVLTTAADVGYLDNDKLFLVSSMNSDNRVFVKFNKPLNGYSLKIINISGEVIFETILKDQNELVISLVKLMNGIYFIRVGSEDEKQVERIAIY